MRCDESPMWVPSKSTARSTRTITESMARSFQRRCRAGGGGNAADQVPLDEAAHVDRDVALALLQLGGDLLERERRPPQVEQREYPALELREHAGRRRRRAQTVDENASCSIHHVILFSTSV